MVCDDGVSIPMHDMAPTGLLGKFIRKTVPSPFAVESSRIDRVELEHIPKRIGKQFGVLKKSVEALGYLPNFFATTPTIGPMAIAIMSMSTSSGQNSFWAVQTVLRRDGELIDSGYHGFVSFLPQDAALITMTQARLPKPREGVDRRMIDTENPEMLVREHRKRMRDHVIDPIEAEELVDNIRRQNQLNVDDCVQKGSIRLATSGEISRIRASAKR